MSGYRHKMRRRKKETLVRWWNDLNHKKGVKELDVAPGEQQYEALWPLMQEIAIELGERVIYGKRH